LSPDVVQSNNLRRARLAAQQGQYHKAVQALSSQGVAQSSSEVKHEMLQKHPQSAPPTIPPAPLPSQVKFDSSAVVKALLSFPAGTAPGPSGLRASHLKEAVSCPSPNRSSSFVQGLTNLVNSLCANTLPPEISIHLCGATLLALRKKSGGFRPIAIGEVLRRLVSKCVVRAVHTSSLTTLSPLQVGVGVSAGAEAIVHAVNCIQDNSSLPPDTKWVLLVDFSNAFNSVSRNCMFNEVRSHIPSISTWVESCYGVQPYLHLGHHVIRSCCGVQQGDPFGPLGFALTLQPIIEKIAASVPGLNLNAWYLDDGTLCGSPQDLLAAINIIEQEGPSRGLQLNRSKSLLFIPSSSLLHNPLPSDIPVTNEGFDLLGSPIGPPSYCLSSVSRRISKLEDALSNLSLLSDSQLELSLLRSCLAYPKISFSLRTCPPSFISDAITSFDNLMFDSLSHLVGCHLSDWSWSKASLPIRLGGLGLRRASLHAAAAFVASFNHCVVLVVADMLGFAPPPSSHFVSALRDLSQSVSSDQPLSLDDLDVSLRQCALSNVIDQNQFDHLYVQSTSPRSKALLLSSSIPHSGDWLKVIPSPSLGLHMQDLEFRLCLRYWLGVQIFPDDSTCSICQSVCDSFGDHHVGCGGNGDRILRHNALRDILFSTTQSAALAPRKEVPSLISGRCSKPADILLPHWTGGKPAALDVSVISPLQNLTVNSSASIQGYALSVGEARKMSVHLDACLSEGISFIPLIVESLGGWSSQASNFIQVVGKHQAQRLGLNPSDCIAHIFQRLSISLWKSNANMWATRTPAVHPWTDGVM
jgi:hypothetical protein